jgi:dTDP-L-rhamnose 4-epimerase
MKVLVTGGAGFIGSHTVDLLLKKGYEVRVLDNLQARVHPRGKPGWMSHEAEFMQGNVANADDLARSLEGVEAVFHLAAYQDHLPDFSTFIRVNTESSALLFELIVAKHLPVQKIVFASSQAVAGDGRYQCKEHGIVVPRSRAVEQLEEGDWEMHCPRCGRYMQSLLTDETTVSPDTTYGISKYTIELLADLLGRRYDIPTVCMRYSCVQGPRNSFYNAYSGVARIFAMRLMHGLPPLCYEDGQQLRDYVNVRDVARANVLAFERPEANFQVYNVGGGRAVSVLEFARLMLREFESDMEPQVPGIYRIGDTRHTVSDISRLRSLGWEPEISVEQNVTEYVSWFRQQQSTDEYFREAERIMMEQNVLRAVKQ